MSQTTLRRRNITIGNIKQAVAIPRTQNINYFMFRGISETDLQKPPLIRENNSI
jgi:hypothetical protein